MDVKTFAKTAHDAWIGAGGADAIRNGMRRIGYSPRDWHDPMATIFEVMHNGSDSDREEFAADLELICDYVKLNS